MDHGKIVSRSKSRPAPDSNDADVPGNLLFAEGKVISVTAYGPRKRARSSPIRSSRSRSPRWTTDRQEPQRSHRPDRARRAASGQGRPGRRHRGSHHGTQEQSRQGTPRKARAKLYDTLTVYIADHFNDAEKYLKEYEELCNIDLDGAPERERKASWKPSSDAVASTYLLAGRQGPRRTGPARRGVREISAVRQGGRQAAELVPAVDDGRVKAAPDVWSRGRIIAMMNNAKPEHREPLEKLIADKWKQLRETNDLQDLASSPHVRLGVRRRQGSSFGAGRTADGAEGAADEIRCWRPSWS